MDAQLPYSLFISDLHLEEAHPEITEIFLKFLKDHTGHADALYILGDFFEVWVGDDDYSPFNQRIIEALQTAVKGGLTIYLMRGNRDFLLSSGFARMTGVILLDDPTVINLYGKELILLHGDSLCTLDIQHQKFRRWAYNPFIQALALMFPLWLRRKVARKIRHYSQERYHQLQTKITDVSQEAVIEVLQNARVNLMIHGHTHRPAIHELSVNSNPAHRIVLGAWHEMGNALFYFQDGHYDLHNFK
jgi:UDP-2,3-diacylglucosamine hydrolase